MSHIDQFELIDGHAFLVLDVFFEHADSVLLFVGAGQLSVGDGSDFKSGHYDINYRELQ